MLYFPQFFCLEILLPLSLLGKGLLMKELLLSTLFQLLILNLDHFYLALLLLSKSLNLLLL
jgi:hypothetical protein